MVTFRYQQTQSSSSWPLSIGHRFLVPCSLPLPSRPTCGVCARRQSPSSSHRLTRPPTPSLHPQAPLLSSLQGRLLCSPLAPDFSSCPCCLRAELPKFSVVKDAFICFVLFLISNLLQTVLQKTIKMSQQNQIAVKVSKCLFSISVLVSLCTGHGL